MLAVIGDLVQDVVVWLDEPARRGTDTRCRITTTRGGSAANVAAFAAPRCPTRFIGCVGDDPAGAALTQQLRGRGVDVRVQQRGATGMVVVMIDPDGERSMFPSRGASAFLEAVEAAWLDGVDTVHLSAYALAGEPAASSMLDAARRVRASGGRLSIDVSSAGLIAQLGVSAFQSLLCELAPDVLSANLEETELLDLATGAGAGAFAGRLDHCIVLARAGADPTRVFRGRERIAEVAVPPVEVIRDLTGAGDAFNAGFLAAWREDDDLVAACRAGHALARRVLGFAGASDGTEASDTATG